MKSCLLFLLFFLNIHRSFAQSLTVNHHSVTEFDSIPEVYKIQAAKLRMLFMDRSVGFNISTYLDCLSTPWSSSLSSCKRYEHKDPLYNSDPKEVRWERVWDRSNWRYEFWPTGCSEDVTCFINFIEPRLDSFDVIGCQFSYLAVTPGARIADPTTGFFGNQTSGNKANTYANFGRLHPDKKLIWWTTSLARGIGTLESESFNAQMRDFASKNNIYLFDVADILSHDPDGRPCFDNRDGVSYQTENYPDDGVDLAAICPHYTTETEGGHLGSASAGGVRVAKAFWVLMAKLAGWKGISTKTKEIKNSGLLIYPNPAANYFYIRNLFSASNDQKITLTIQTLEGKTLMTKVLQNQDQNNETEYRIPLQNIPNGYYLIDLLKDGTHYLHKQVICR